MTGALHPPRGGGRSDAAVAGARAARMPGGQTQDPSWDPSLGESPSMRKNKCFSLSRSAAAPRRHRTGLDRAMPQRQRARLGGDSARCDPRAPVGDRVQLSALWPLSAAEHSSEECSQPKKVLAREPTTVTAIPTPETTSQTVYMLSWPLRPCEGTGPSAFPLVRVLLVGATGFEPVTPSVSAKHREPLCDTPFSQVGSDRRCGRETLS